MPRNAQEIPIGVTEPSALPAPAGHQLFNIDQLRRIVTGVAGVAVFVALVVVHGFAQRGER